MLLAILLSWTTVWVNAQTAVAPTEPEILWERAGREMQSLAFGDAFRTLQVLNQKYPTFEHRSTALRMQGQAALESGRRTEARSALRAVVQTATFKNEGFLARLGLAQVDLLERRSKSALLTCTELDAIRDLPPEIRAEGLVLKAQALMQLNQWPRADLALDAVKALGTLPPRVQALEQSTRLRWKLHECETSVPSASEKVIQQAMNARGICLLEAQKPLREVFLQKDFWEAQRLRTQVAQDWALGFQAYWERCHNPPPPPRTAQLTSAQVRIWREELKDYLLEQCEGTRKQALSLLSSVSDLPERQLLQSKLEQVKLP